MITSAKAIKYYRMVAFRVSKLKSLTACYRAQEVAGVQYSEAERTRLWEASRKLDEAEKIFTEVWSARIGDLITLETRVEVQ